MTSETKRHEMEVSIGRIISAELFCVDDFVEEYDIRGAIKNVFSHYDIEIDDYRKPRVVDDICDLVLDYVTYDRNETQDAITTRLDDEITDDDWDELAELTMAERKNIGLSQDDVRKKSNK